MKNKKSLGQRILSNQKNKCARCGSNFTTSRNGEIFLIQVTKAPISDEKQHILVCNKCKEELNEGKWKPSELCPLEYCTPINKGKIFRNYFLENLFVVAGISGMIGAGVGIIFTIISTIIVFSYGDVLAGIVSIFFSLIFGLFVGGLAGILIGLIPGSIIGLIKGNKIASLVEKWDKNGQK